jgi:predicted homoserine dehydrogenase-like protein
MNIEILGSGFMGTTHARAYAKIPGVSIAAVSSRNLDKAEKLESRRQRRLRGPLDHRGPVDQGNQQNACPHKATIAALKAGKHAIKGARLLFVPPHSSDLNPIEQVFAKRKHLMR